MQGTKHFGKHFASSSLQELVGFTYLDWDGDSTDKKSTSGYVYMVENGSICYPSKKQHTISLSSSEEEYKGAVNATKQCVWLKGILGELGFAFNSPVVIWCENQSKIKISIDTI